MASECSITILNVGHGNAAVLRDAELTTVFDTGGEHVGGRLLDYLKSEGVAEIESLVLSHGDEDHIGSAATLLLAPELAIRKVFINTDATKRTQAFAGLQVALRAARREKQTVVTTSLTVAQSAELECRAAKIEILYPYPESTLTGPGGLDIGGHIQTTNSLSAVIRLIGEGPRRVLLAADCGMEALKLWRDEHLNPSAEVVVFPHHGGRPGKCDTVEFAEEFARLTSPSTFVFSIHSKKFDLPRAEIVEALRGMRPDAVFVCTQLPDRLVSECDHPHWLPHKTNTGLLRELHLRVRLDSGEILILPDV